MDPFYQETVDYVKGMEKENIDVVFNEYDGCFHAFEAVPNTKIGNNALDFTFDNFGKFYDKYVIC